MVSGDHDDLNSSAPTFAHGIGDGSPRRVNHGDEPDEAEVFDGEIHVIGVKLESLGELLVWQEEVAEACGQGQERVSTRGGGRRLVSTPSPLWNGF